MCQHLHSLLFVQELFWLKMTLTQDEETFHLRNYFNKKQFTTTEMETNETEKLSIHFQEFLNYLQIFLLVLIVFFCNILILFNLFCFKIDVYRV